MSEVVLSAATREDVTSVYTLECASFSVPWSREDFFYCLDNENCVFIKACVGGVTAGYVIASIAADEGDILNVAVGCDFRRRGIGRSLLRASLSLLQTRGVNSVYLEVRESNSAAIGLYAAEGFLPLDRRFGYYSKPKEDAIVMRLSLGDFKGGECIF